MKVETYEVQEVTECMADEEQIATTKELIEKLGLSAQEKFYEREGDSTVCPYRKMTKRESWVYGQLLTRQTELKQYADSPVPLRILQIASHAVELMPGKLMVWHPENADVKDPVLTLRVGSDYQYEQYILARWGDELENFEVLAQKAKDIFKVKVMAALEKCRGEVEAMMKRLDSVADMAEKEGKSELPHFYERW